MAIQKYQDPFFDVMPSSFSTMLDRFFNDTVTTRGQWTSFSPKVDAYETDQSYDIEAALPGLKQDDVKVSFDQGRLTISGERKFDKERTERQYHVVESSYGSFTRTFQLPTVAEPGKIEASFDNGVLHVHVPKGQQQPSQHQIPVRSGSSNGASGNAPKSA
ncbi:HSP20 family protein [Hymenobacter daecheongensis DSM 21074]|uniref:HSP20 family protein n=1 Tax=Hymenobacter daecheongensis DSM 21074 TaxID=1121955 RepID=A0A1M6MDH7_9BACT|nr:Hsp20/alpha crystallin family protein [Hymenobacter daecheongensis]SHJ81528.1 HSP20 family protein [Hymenobacter daecheongensis DSM 21074]